MILWLRYITLWYELSWFCNMKDVILSKVKIPTAREMRGNYFGKCSICRGSKIGRLLWCVVWVAWSCGWPIWFFCHPMPCFAAFPSTTNPLKSSNDLYPRRYIFTFQSSESLIENKIGADYVIISFRNHAKDHTIGKGKLHSKTRSVRNLWPDSSCSVFRHENRISMPPKTWFVENQEIRWEHAGAVIVGAVVSIWFEIKPTGERYQHDL